MEFEMNPQRESYLNARGKIVLNACPGSGKTTSIVRKLISLEVEYGRYSGVACLSFTNVAKDEINEKFSRMTGRGLKFPNEVSTIDSFINRYITLPYFYLVNENVSKRPRILDDNSFFDEVWKPKYNYKGLDGKSFCFAYEPSTIRFESDGTYSSSGYRPDPSKVAPEVFDSYCKALKQWQLKSGLISTNDSAFIARHLLQKNKRIAELLVQRFPHIIIDEAQDSSAIQHDIFDLLIQANLSNIELVGDPYQSLYEWRDADPSLFINKYLDKENWNGLDLTDNRRSPQRIIDCFSHVRKVDELKISSASSEDRAIPIIVYKYSDTNSPLIVKHFETICKNYELQNNQILVRGNDLKNQMLGRTVEQRPWGNNFAFQIIRAKSLYSENQIKNSLKLLRRLVIEIVCPGLDYHGFKDAEQGLKIDHGSNSLLLEILQELPSLSLSISEWTVQTQTFLSEKLNLETPIDFGLRTRTSKFFDKKIISDSVELHFKKSSSDGNIPITTIHQAKGKTLDATLVFFNKSNHKDNITFSSISNEYEDVPPEKQRLIYVALSRSEHLLAMAFPDQISDNEIVTKFGSEVSIVTDIQLQEINNENQQ